MVWMEETSSVGSLWDGHISSSILAIPTIMRPSSWGRVAGSVSFERTLASGLYGNGRGMGTFGNTPIPTKQYHHLAYDGLILKMSTLMEKRWCPKVHWC